MAAPDQNRYTQFVNLFTHNNFFGNLCHAVVSPLLNCICTVSKQKDARLYTLPNAENQTPFFWRCSSTVKSCFFSEDGRYLLLILSVNSIQIYEINKENVSLVNQIKASTLVNLLYSHKIDFSAASKVEPLKLTDENLIVVIDKKIIINFEWKSNNLPINYIVPVNNCIDISISEKYIFLLMNNGVIYAYNLLTGEKFSEELNACLANRSNCDISVGYNFSRICVHKDSKILLVVNQDQESVLFDVKDMFSDEVKAKAQPDETKRDSWLWRSKSKSVVEDTKMNLVKIIKKVSAPNELVVSYIQSSFNGFFVFYSVLGMTKCIAYKIIDELTGEVLLDFTGLVESEIVRGSYLPLVMSDSILSLCLGMLCNDYFIMKLCEIIPNFGFSKEFERTAPSQQPHAGSDYHLKFLKIVLNLHTNIFAMNLKSLGDEKGLESSNGYSLESSVLEKKIIERIDDLFSVVLNYNLEDVGEKYRVREDMLRFCFRHAVNLLDATYKALKNKPESELFPGLLKNLLTLLEHVKHLDPLGVEWETWRNSTDVEVVQEAVVEGTIALAHLFLVTNREWPLDNVEDKFKETCTSWVVELISVGDLEKAKIILTNLGCDPLQYLKTLCLETSEPLMRDLLADHLIELNQLSDEEINVWKFCKKIEGALSSVIKRYQTFEHKMSVSARDRIKVPVYKLRPYNGSVDLQTMLKCSEDWKGMVLTEVYFSTGDVALEKELKKELCWQYLLEMNHIDLLKSWIDLHCDPSSKELLLKSSDYLTKSFYSLFSEWPVTESMLDMISWSTCMTTTKDAILDHCVSYGFFSPGEKNSLRSIIYRIENNSSLSCIRSIFGKQSSNLNIDHFDKMIFDKCSELNLKSVIMTCLQESNYVRETGSLRSEHPWLDIWNVFDKWNQNRNNKALLLEALKKSFGMFPLADEEIPYFEIALALIEGKEIAEIISEKGNDCNLLKVPLVEIGWQTSHDTHNRPPDVTLYDLLQCSKVPTDKIFLWQAQNKGASEILSTDLIVDFPHFGHAEMGVRYGFKQNLDYIYYLKQARPSFACNLFIVESLKTQRRLTTNMIRRTCGMTHGLALRYWRNTSIGNACIAFIAMLGDIASASTLRIHLASIESIITNLSNDEVNYISTLAHGIVTKDVTYLQEMASLLEKSTMKKINNEKSVSQLQEWALPVSFCNAHDLPLPTAYPKYLAKNREWFFLILCLDIFRYPYEQAIELIEDVESKILKSHLIRALTRTTLKLSTTSPSKSPPKILLEPENTGKEEPESVNIKDSKDIFQSFVSNIYTEVLNTIQTFTDKNIILPWSCEQDPDTDVLLTLLKCENEPDTSKSLLLSSMELQSPVLAVLATCFQSENVLPNLIAWFVAAIPTSLPRGKRREEGQQLLERYYDPKEVGYLFIQFFSTGYFQTLYRGMSLFMAENPLTLFIGAVYQAIVVLDFDASLENLKSFVGEMTHCRVKGTPMLFKSSILFIVAQLVENILTRSDILNSVKRHFLRILAESDLKGVDSNFPNYMLWYQIGEILESSEVNLDFVQLYDITAVSEELEEYLNNLVENHQFTQALEICSLLSLNKDKLVIAMWTHQLEISIKNECDLKKVWSDSSAAFKDENVNPNVAACFYYDMASRFQSANPVSLKNRYLALDFCLNWRRCIEDTSSASFREESDSIELEKWRCCIEPEFDLGILKSSTPVDVSHSLLVSLWSSSKVLVRSQVLNETETERVEELINMFLDQGDLYRPLRLSAFFKSNNQDLATITSCLKVIQGEITPSELAKFNVTLTSMPKRLHSSSTFGEMDLTDYEIVPSREQQQIITLLSKLCQTVNHGKVLVNKIFICYRLSVNLDSSYKDIASERDYLDLLARSSSTDCLNKLNIVNDLISLANLTGSELATYLKDKIVCAVSEYYASGLLVPITLWGVSLDTDFHLIINMMENPSLLGLELLNASLSLPINEAVEVLIRSHDCYTACCNVEGIGHVLRSARLLASKALQEEQWQYLVRLLVGIGRYTDMSYGFQMLKDNHQFEHLLKKGLQKTPGLHVAIADFLHRHCPDDRELGKMVAAHYGRHAKHASLWQEEADEILGKLPIVDNVLKDSSKVRQALNVALDNYSHAAQLFVENCLHSVLCMYENEVDIVGGITRTLTYLLLRILDFKRVHQAGKLNRALKVSYRAQVIALQISLLGGPSVLTINSRPQFQNLVNDCLSVAQTMIISRAYDMEPDWVAALHERWVLKGDKAFFSDMKSSGVLSPQVLNLYLFKYDSEQLSNNKAKERMKQLIPSSSQESSPYMKDMRKKN